MSKLDELDHPCRDTCSGWAQGFERGSREAQSRITSLEQIEKGLRERVGELESERANIVDSKIDEFLEGQTVETGKNFELNGSLSTEKALRITSEQEVTRLRALLTRSSSSQIQKI